MEGGSQLRAAEQEVGSGQHFGGVQCRPVLALPACRLCCSACLHTAGLVFVGAAGAWEGAGPAPTVLPHCQEWWARRGPVLTQSYAQSSAVSHPPCRKLTQKTTVTASLA